TAGLAWLLGFKTFRELLILIFDEFKKGNLEDSKIPEVAQRTQLLNNPCYKSVRKSLFATLFWWMDSRDGPLSDPRVRRAIHLAIDRSHFVKVVRQNRFDEAHSLIPEGMFAYNPELPKNIYDVEQAKELLAAAGYPGGQGMPPLELWSAVDTPASQKDHQAIKDDLAAIGIHVTLHAAQTWKQYSRNVLGKRPGILARNAWFPSLPDPDDVLYALFHSQSKFNRGHYHNQKVDELLEKAREEWDDSKRIGLYREAEKLIIADVPTINLVHYKFEHLFQPYVHGVHANSLGEHYIPMKTIWLDTAQHGLSKTAKSE
ncbi:ABC transporter substrate-binding protein, partial [Candidatus Entotheonella palauensis]|uniref:ABC transporter substrate-binding protein n=1 Tax=Candidatus Entotheonella palauensis TaxID=93172 RepID=UPI00117819B1